MALTSSGQIKVSEINTELGRTSTTSNTSLKSCSDGTNGTINTANEASNRPNGTAPHQMTEFYSYNHSASSTSYTSIVFYYSEDNASSACESEESVTVYYDSSEEVDVDLQLYSDSDGGETASGGYYKYVFDNGGWAVNEDGEITLSFSCGRSERRLKYNIEFIGDSPMGIPMYHFNYKDESHGKGRFVGTMVDDLQRLGFEKVLTHTEDGIFVNYDKIDVPFESVTN